MTPAQTTLLQSAITRWMKAEKLTDDEAARRLGISWVRLGMWLNGHALPGSAELPGILRKIGETQN